MKKIGKNGKNSLIFKGIFFSSYNAHQIGKKNVTEILHVWLI